MFPVDIDSAVYSRFAAKQAYADVLVWTEFSFAIFLALLGVIELISYQETISGFILLSFGLVLFNLFIIFYYSNRYNSAVLLRVHATFAGFLAGLFFLFTAFSILFIHTEKSTRYTFRNTVSLVWAIIFCFIVLLTAFAVGSNSRAKELDSLEIARQEFFKKIMLTTQKYIQTAPQFEDHPKNK